LALSDSIWIVGSTRSGKTSRLVELFCQQAESAPAPPRSSPLPPALVFAAIGDNRIELADRIAAASRGRFSFDSSTPLGFFQDEVILFYPLLVKRLGLRSQFPVRLRPETEQALATRLWRSDLDSGKLAQAGVAEYYLVRRLLDILQLAALAGVPPEDIPVMLQAGLAGQDEPPELWQSMGEALLHWREWCLERGLLTYGIITELYWRYLLPDSEYRQHLCHRYRAVLADDVDEYPAIAHTLFTVLLDAGIPGVFTYNADGSVRLGLGADPQQLSLLANRCQVEQLQPPEGNLGTEWGAAIAAWVQTPVLLPQLPSAIQSIQAVSRAQLLRTTAEFVADAIHRGQVLPSDVAIVGPGLDPIARYTLREILTRKGIAVEALNDQQPLAAFPMIRALLTLLALVYPGLGRLLSQDAIAELLIVLSQRPLSEPKQWELGSESAPDASATSGADPRPPSPSTLNSAIDPVRAGLLVDHCFVPDLEHPHLLPATSFPRWDRLGYRATQAYEALRQWIEAQQLQQQQRLLPSPVTLLDRAIQQFLSGGSYLSSDRLAALRELMETAQHYWEVEARLRQVAATQPDLAADLRPDPNLPASSPVVQGGTASPPAARIETATSSVEGFIQLLRGGTITADPYPAQRLVARRAVTLATIFQYRANRCVHRWQFWLDAGSTLWLTGGGALFGAPIFLQAWSGRMWGAAEALEADQQRLGRQLQDLLYRAGDRVYLCHSDLATSGQEQAGPLLTLVNAAPDVVVEPVELV